MLKARYVTFGVNCLLRVKANIAPSHRFFSFHFCFSVCLIRDFNVCCWFPTFFFFFLSVPVAFRIQLLLLQNITNNTHTRLTQSVDIMVHCSLWYHSRCKIFVFLFSFSCTSSILHGKGVRVNLSFGEFSLHVHDFCLPI